MMQFNNLYDENKQKNDSEIQNESEDLTKLQELDGKSFKEIKKGKSFYVALFVCLTAVLAAGWSTYVSVKDFLQTDDTSYHKKDSASKTNAVPDYSKKKINHNDNNSLKDEILKETPDLKSIDKNELFNQTDNVNPDVPEKTKTVSSNNIQDMKIVYPVTNIITKEFSEGKPVHSQTFNDWRIHDGTDLKAEVGSEVRAITGGVVKDVYKDEIYGYTMVINHDGNFTAYYCGLDEKINLKKNDRVEAEQQIAFVGSVPSEVLDEPHLHLMIKKDGKSIDPVLVLEKIEECD